MSDQAIAKAIAKLAEECVDLEEERDELKAQLEAVKGAANNLLNTMCDCSYLMFDEKTNEKVSAVRYADTATNRAEIEKLLEGA